jgi:hypothetical protein
LSQRRIVLEFHRFFTAFSVRPIFVYTDNSSNAKEDWGSGQGIGGVEQNQTLYVCTWKEFGDLAPAVAELVLGVEENLILCIDPVSLLNGWIEMVEPALTALLAYATRKLLCDGAPLHFAHSALQHGFAHYRVFFFSPRAFV